MAYFAVDSHLLFIVLPEAKPMPSISVIVPLYNAERTIESTLKSVFCQTFTDLEVIVIDDGSTDSSLTKVEQLTDPRLQVYSFANAGAPASRNRGFARSCGDFIAFLDADDQWAKDKLAAQMAALQANPEAAIAYSWTEYIDKDDRVVAKGQTIKVTSQEDTYKRLLVNNFLDSGSNPLIRREAVEAVGGFDETLQACQDYDFYLRLAMRFRFVPVPRYQIRYRFSPGSISENTAKMEQQALQFLEKSFATAPESLQYLKTKRLTYLYRYLMMRSLEGSPNRRRSWLALSYLIKAIWTNPSLVRHQARFMVTMALKSLVGLLLPSRIAIAFFQRFSTRLQRQEECSTLH